MSCILSLPHLPGGVDVSLSPVAAPAAAAGLPEKLVHGYRAVLRDTPHGFFEAGIVDAPVEQRNKNVCSNSMVARRGEVGGGAIR